MPSAEILVKHKKVLSGTNALAYYAEQSMMKKKRPESINALAYFLPYYQLSSQNSIFTLSPFMPSAEILVKLKKGLFGTNALAYYAE
jgi:hypothetical protein